MAKTDTEIMSEAADLLVEALNELGVGDVGYPVPIDNAIVCVERALALLQGEDYEPRNI